MSEFYKTTSVGDTRKVWKKFNAGKEFEIVDGVTKITKDCWMECTETFQYKYPASKQEPMWVLTSYHFGTARADNPNPPKPKPPEPEKLAPIPWYRRWFGLGPKIPQARVVSE